MRLNAIKPAAGARKVRVRVGRGIGSGLGKTAGRGHKGQHARSGASHTIGFEGGQMPLYRRLPKVGFKSRKQAFTAQVFLYQLHVLPGDTVDMDSLRAAGLIGARARRVKLVASGQVERPLKVSGVVVTAGAKAAIEAAGGQVE